MHNWTILRSHYNLIASFFFYKGSLNRKKRTEMKKTGNMNDKIKIYVKNSFESLVFLADPLNFIKFNLGIELLFTIF
jgi:hypothetical protein